MSGFVCGTYPSDMSKVPEVKLKASGLPESFNLNKNIYPVINQGNRGICCSVSITDTIKYLENFKKVNYKIPRDFFYNNRSNKKIDGMTVHEAMKIAKNKKYISKYGKLQSIESMKACLVTQGPIIVCFNVYNFDDKFWRKTGSLIGGHAVVFVGYNKEGFILKNSWGSSYGKAGFVTFPYEDFKYIREAWTVFC